MKGMKMSIQISAAIEELTGEGYQCVMVSFPKDEALQILGRFAGLCIDRYKTLEIRDKNAKLIISKGEMKIMYLGRGFTAETNLTQDILDLILGCCYDQVFAMYDDPHVDFEFERFDLTIGWR